MNPLLRALTADVPPELAEEVAAVAGVEEMLEAIVRSGRDTHADLQVDEGAFMAHLGRHLQKGEVGRQIAELRAPDVHFVVACLAGHPSAQARLDARLRAVAGQALGGIRLSAAEVDDVLQGLLERLLVERKLATYSGRGPLDGWLRVALARAALSATRGLSRKDARAEEADALLDLVASDDPQLSTLRSHCAPALERAIEAAFAALPTEERTLLRLHVVDGLTIDDLARLFRAHRATMARRLARVRTAVFEGTRARAMDALGLLDSEFQSLMGAMMSQLDLTIRRILETPSR